MKRLHFDTKENNNRRREREFLALTPGERVEVFLKDCSQYAIFTSAVAPEKKQNLVLRKKPSDGI